MQPGKHSSATVLGRVQAHVLNTFLIFFVYLKGTHAVDSGLAHDWLTMAPFR
jgi:hypothetical protein